MRLSFIQHFDTESFQLDIVGFLAILGEGSLEPIAQVATLSYLIYLPRLIPAPQTFLKTQRPEKLETTSNAKVVGVHSGNASEDIHHVAHALHRGDKLAANTVQCVRVEEDERVPRPSIKRYGPLAILAYLGFAMSAALFALSLYYHDGMALLATISLSLLSTNTGIANKWQPTPNDPKPDKHSPPGDVVIKYPQGAFIVVKCSERTARYLYFNASERCIYSVRSTPVYRFLSLVSTLLLMAGVISLANSTIYLQVAFAGSYMGINIAYWIGAALPPAKHWDLSRLKLRHVKLSGGIPPRGSTDKIKDQPQTYTEALWKTIAVTGNKDWLLSTGWAPKTKAWAEWLDEAEGAAIDEPMQLSWNGDSEIWTIRNWDSRQALSTILRTKTETFKTGTVEV